MLPSRNFHFLSTLFFSLFFVSLSLSNPDTTALLAFKAASDPSNSLSSWATSSDPCSGSWLGVTCDPATHQVTKLVLENLNLTGSTQPLSQLAQLRLLSLNHNLLSALNLSSSWPHLNHLYLSHNRFAGPLPSEISNLRRLRRLDLSHNQFSGELPLTELTQLPHLLTLWLESNSFTGTLSSASSYYGTLLDFNVSYNNFSGEIPTSLSKFEATAFAGNVRLCGKPLPYDCSGQTVPNRNATEQSRHSDRIDVVSSNALLLLIGIAVALLVMGVTATWIWRRKRTGSDGGTHKKTANGYGYVSKHYGPGEIMKKKSGANWTEYSGPVGGFRESEEMVVLEGCKGVNTVGDLLKASAEMLGKGSVGTTFKVVGDGGNVVVVKRVREKRNGGKEIDGFLRQIGGLRHSNILSLRAYHNSNFELLLVYDFMPNGSLHFVLHGNRGPGRSPLAWATRLKLASGSAQGLAFLHGCCSKTKAKLFHGNLTSSNILVDHMGNACIADIGLQQILPAPYSSCSAYRAPEFMLPNVKSPGKFTQKCDVYSFGVVLLEILTGRMVGEEGEEMSLLEWVNLGVEKKCSAWEVFDFELLGDKEMEDEMWALLQVGLLCLTPLPKDRPTMGMVHRMIEDIRKKGVREDGDKSILDDLTSDSFSSSPSLSESTP